LAPQSEALLHAPPTNAARRTAMLGTGFGVSELQAASR
jgi:hypothetical protein